jgi:hypothetical protein
VQDRSLTRSKSPGRQTPAGVLVRLTLLPNLRNRKRDFPHPCFSPIGLTAVSMPWLRGDLLRDYIYSPQFIIFEPASSNFTGKTSMLICIACGNAYFRHRMITSMRGGKSYAWRKH